MDNLEIHVTLDTRRITKASKIK